MGNRKREDRINRGECTRRTGERRGAKSGKESTRGGGGKTRAERAGNKLEDGGLRDALKKKGW